MPSARGPVDLHVHSTASDGSDAPAALPRLAADAGLSAIALTDHDTLGGLEDARAAARAVDVEVVAGVELSCDTDGVEVHLLGYFVDPADGRLLDALTSLREDRADRNARIVGKLADLGLDVTMEDVLREAEGADEARGGSAGARSVGRPHVAAALMRKGHVASIQEAFDEYLADGRPAFVPRAKLAPADAVRLVHDAGGVAVLAHAFTLPAKRRETLVRALVRDGLDGLEITYPRHDDALRATLAALAAELDLVPTGGSDYHGTRKPDVALGRGVRGNVHVPAGTLDALRERAGR